MKKHESGRAAACLSLQGGGKTPKTEAANSYALKAELRFCRECEFSGPDPVRVTNNVNDLR